MKYFLALMVLLPLAMPARADQWMQAVVREQSSANGQFSVQVIPGDSWGDVAGFTDRPKGKYATAEWYRSNGDTREKLRTITLLNPVAPVDFLVTDNGGLITLDNWHNVGYGNMLVIYSPTGEVVKKYSLGELYSYRDIRRFGMSTSSVLWRCSPVSPLALNSPTELLVDDTIGGRLIVRPDTGAFEYRRGAGTCKEEAPAGAPPPTPDRVQALPWGEAVGGLQLNVDPGNVRGPLPGDRQLLDLYVWMRNVSDDAVPANMLDGTTYNFEYEIDGTWYAFDQTAPIRTTNTIVRATLATRAREQFAAQARISDFWVTIAPGAATTAYLSVPLVSPSPTLQLHEVTASGPGRRFEPKPGSHTLRVRPRGVLELERPVPVSNAITITLRPLPEIETRAQEVSFSSSRDTPLGSLQFVSGPAGDQALLRQALARPPQPSSVPRVVHSTALQVFEPLPSYDLRLSRTANAPNPLLPTTFTNYRYVVRSGGQSAAVVELADYTNGPYASTDGPAFIAINSADGGNLPFDALQELAGMDAVRGNRYEPRLLRVSGDQGTAMLEVVWLHSSSGKPDLLYLPRNPNFRGTTRVESGKLYTAEEFLAAALAP